MDRLSLTTFGVARFFMAICVFFCHVFESFNHYGFLFVSVFFFMSGYGMEISGKRKTALYRLIPYLLYFAWFTSLYVFFFRVFPYPSSWFLIVYFLVMLLYRFIFNIYGLLWSFLFVALVFAFLGFEFGWSASMGSFVYGVYFARKRNFTFLNTLFFVPCIVLLFFKVEAAMWSILPLFSWLVLSFSSWRFFSFLAPLGRYTFHFYCVHCFVLGVFGVTWTFGGIPEFWGVLLSFGLSFFLSVLFKDYLFKYPKAV